MTVNILLLEGGADLASRVRGCLSTADVNVFTRSEDWLQFSAGRSELDGAIVATSFLDDARFRQEEWSLAQGLPVLWIGAQQPSMSWLRGKNPVVLLQDFSCIQLRSRLEELGVIAADAQGAGYVPRVEQLDAAEDFSAKILHCSSLVTELLDDCNAYARINSNVLLIGQTGTGKELFARAIAKGNPDYGKGPFVPVNCGAIPDDLFESLFFGHAKGSFTGAWRSHKGYLEQADGGTLFLDEIGDLPLQQQVKLLRALEDGVFQPVGGLELLRSDYRLIAATNLNLGNLIRDGRFRADLYYRIAVIEVAIPSLDDRGEDDKALLFTHAFNAAWSQIEPGGSVAVPIWLMDMVVQRQYPGNVREIFNLANRVAAIYSRYGRFDPERFRPILKDSQNMAFAVNGIRRRTRPAAAGQGEERERTRIMEALNRHGGRRREAAEELGISRKTLWEKMRKHELLTPNAEFNLVDSDMESNPGEIA